MFSTPCSIPTRSRHASACVALALLFTTPALAQETRATVTGIVKDAQGAVVPGVTVTVLNTATNLSTDDVTNQSGVFTIQKLQPGPVRVTASVPGFKTVVREGITLRTAETVTVKVTTSGFYGAAYEFTMKSARESRRVQAIDAIPLSDK